MNGNLFAACADYSYTVEDGVVCIIDNDNGRSVTNDAEAVIQDLVKAGLDLTSLPVIYRDTCGVWDQLAVENQAFCGFRSLHEMNKEAAKVKVQET